MSTFRFDWYQNQASVFIDIFAKNLKPEDINVSFGERSVSVLIRNNSCSYEKEFSLSEFINSDESRFNVGKNKIEISLKKLEEFKVWETLEMSESAAPSLHPPKYPSSSKKPLDPESIADTEIDAEPTGDAAINALFQKIYANATEDTKRAMMKSFIESKGTVLSTNWDEVGEREIEPVPPKNN